jgi:hypothetical protein
MQTNLTTIPVTAGALEREWLAQGFAEGPPAHVAADLVDIDRRIYSRMRCVACGHGSHKVQPYHRGREYRLLCSCRKCNSGVEA